jgi:hypothetical protein
MENLVGVWAAGTVIIWSGLLTVVAGVAWARDKWFNR